jgi:glucose-1-phosphate thymidylyltransferase
MKGLILPGGHGKQQLTPVANKPILFHAIKELAGAGITEIGIIVGPDMEQIREAVGEGARWDVMIKYIEQEKPLGLANCVKISKDFLGWDSFVFYLGDNILKGGIAKYVKNFRDSKADASILLAQVDDPSKYIVAELKSDGSIRRLVKNPKDPPSKYALVGIYMFSYKILRAIENIKPSESNELEITDAIQFLIDNRDRVESEHVSGWWRDTGKPRELFLANELLLEELTPGNEGTIDEQVSIMGKVSIGKGTVIKSGTVIKGPVMIGKNCVIGPDTYIGPYTSIGDGSSIVNCEIESSIVMDGAEICTKKEVVDSIIGRGARIYERDDLPKGHKFLLGDDCEIEI